MRWWLLLIAAVLALGCLSLVVYGTETARRMSGDLIIRVVPDDVLPAPGSTPAESPTQADVQHVMQILDELEVSDRGSGVEYNRGDWGQWIDADQDCQNTRAEVLISESLAPVSFAPEDDGDMCRVIAGRWVGPWTGEVFTDASDVDIDHHVPLGHAHLSGGWDWSPERKRAYANDLTHPASLQATSAPINRSKGKQAPDEWRPEESAGWCRYAADWISVKKAWDLTVTSAEVGALEKMLATCDDDVSWGLSGPPGG